MCLNCKQMTACNTHTPLCLFLYFQFVAFNASTCIFTGEDGGDAGGVPHWDNFTLGFVGLILQLQQLTDGHRRPLPTIFLSSSDLLHFFSWTCLKMGTRHCDCTNVIKENKITSWLFSRSVLKGSSGKASVDA